MNIDVEKFRRVNRKVHAHLFKKAIQEHMALPRFAYFGGRCRLDSLPYINARFKGMVRMTKSKYGIYNKAADNPGCKMHKKCFPWWHA